MRHRRRGVKREHSVLEAFRPVYERVAALEGVEGVIPGRIAANPTHHPGLVLKGATRTGFKLLAKTTTSIQEVFVIARHGQVEAVRARLAAVLTRPAGDRPATPPREDRARRPARPPGPRRPGAGWRNPGIIPVGPTDREPLRFTADWLPAGSRVGERAGEATRRRLLWLRLRRARWRRRFGAALRRAPRRPR